MHGQPAGTRTLVWDRLREARGDVQGQLLRMSAPRSTPQRVAWLGGGLGVAQLIAWGTTYYAIAVLGEPMQRDLAISSSQLYGLFTWSLALSGVLAPWAGRLVDQLGGRRVLMAGALLGAAGFSLLACAHSVWALAAGWTVMGVAMALGLYDTCFAAVAQSAPHAYRRAVTAVTLIAGLASTCFWPVSHHLVEALGWRATCGIFIALLLLCIPLYLLALPAHAHSPAASSEHVVGKQADDPQPTDRSARMLALAFAGAALVSGALSAHLVGTLGRLHFAPEHAVWIASSIGVMQVLGRFIELRFGTGLLASRLGLLTFASMTASLVLLLAVPAVPPVVLLFVVLYGAANGVMTIVKAVLPVEMFGTREVGAVLGRFAAPSLVARAVAPWVYALLEQRGGPTTALTFLAVVAALSLAAYVAVQRASGSTVAGTSSLVPDRARRP